MTRIRGAEASGDHTNAKKLSHPNPLNISMHKKSTLLIILLGVSGGCTVQESTSVKVTDSSELKKVRSVTLKFSSMFIDYPGIRNWDASRRKALTRSLCEHHRSWVMEEIAANGIEVLNGSANALSVYK